MIASVHVADVGVPAASGSRGRLRPWGRSPDCATRTSLLAAPLGGSVMPSPQFGRAAVVAFWDDDDSLDRFLSDDPLAAKFASGWHVRLEPLRTHGSWPGLADDLPKDRNVEHEGPVAALTMGRPRASQLIRFLRTSSKAENSAVGAPGLTWATGLARPLSFVSTCSLWESTPASSTYAYGNRDRVRPRRDRERCCQSVSSRAGVHPLPPVRVSRSARRQEPPRRELALTDLASPPATDANPQQTRLRAATRREILIKAACE